MPFGPSPYKEEIKQALRKGKDPKELLKRFPVSGRTVLRYRREIETELEKELAAEEDALALELKTGRAQEIIARRKLRIKQLEVLLKEAGGRSGVNGETGEKAALDQLARLSLSSPV
jgi:hypothetical protein